MMDKKKETFWNLECDENIVCPYCGEEYEPSYEDTCINGALVDCYTEEEEIYECENCGKKFVMKGEPVWRYRTETIDGECTQEEAEEEGWI